MADFGAPVAQNIDISPNRGIQTLSGLLGLQQQRQALAGQAAVVQQEQQTARQRSGIATFMSNFDPAQHTGPDGTLDLDNVLTDPKLRQAAGDQFPDLMGKMVQIKQAQLAAKQQLVNLNDSTRTQFLGMVGGLRTDPDVIAGNQAGAQKIQSAIGQWASTSPDAARTAQIFGSRFQNVPLGRPDPQKASPLLQAVSNAQLMGQDAASQAANQRPSYMSTGSQLVQTAPQAAGGNLGAAPSYTVGIPPGWAQYEDPVTHAQYIRNIQTGESRPIGATYTNPGAPTAPQTPPPTNAAPATSVSAPPNYKPGEAATIAANTQSGADRYNALVNASVDSPARINVLDNIINLAGSTRTGPGSGWKAAAETAIGQTPGFAGAATDAAKYNELVKFLHQNALRTWQAAGGTGTNQQLSTIEGANPNVTQDPTTIVALARYNKAGELALQAKATAHNTWMHQPGNNFANQSDFETQWRQNFDPILFQLKTWTPEEAKANLSRLPQSRIDDLAVKQAWLKKEGVY